jgi:hypothetical protein
VSARPQLAWLMWCFNEGYVTVEDRAFMENWMGEHQDNAEDEATRQRFLAMADEVLNALAADLGPREMPNTGKGGMALDDDALAAGTGRWGDPVPGYDNDDELRRYALDEQRLHDPANQDHNYERCEHCHYTRHPCDVYELATAVLYLLDRGRTDA